jgi:hypothetical protein
MRSGSPGLELSRLEDILFSVLHRREDRRCQGTIWAVAPLADSRAHLFGVSSRAFGVGSLKQLPKPVCQQFEGLPQSAELPNPDYRDGSGATRALLMDIKWIPSSRPNPDSCFMPQPLFAQSLAAGFNFILTDLSRSSALLFENRLGPQVWRS